MRYPFKCPECGHETYRQARIQDGPGLAPACLQCFMEEGAPLVWMKRVWSATPAIFRGGGWASRS